MSCRDDIGKLSDDAENNAAVASSGSNKLNCQFVRFVQSVQRNCISVQFGK